MLTRTSATGCAAVYNRVLAKSPAGVPFPPNWQVAPSLRPEHVWDAFTIVSLLDFHDSEGGQLKVPHDGDQNERFQDAVRHRNQYIRYHGLPDRGYFGHVSQWTTTPLRAIWATTILSILPGLLDLASPVAANAIFALTAMALDLSYIIPIFL